MMQFFCADLNAKRDLSPDGRVRLVDENGRALTLWYEDALGLEEEVRSFPVEIATARGVGDLPDSFIRRHLSALAKARDEIELVAARLPGMIEQFRALAGNVPASDVPGPLDDMLVNLERVHARKSSHLEVLDRSARLADECPARLVLPIGATVRLRHDYDYPGHCALDPRRFDGFRKLPAAGSVAFVAGNGYGQDERSVALILVDPFADANASYAAYSPDACHGYAICVCPEDVEVLSLARTLDGVEFRGVEAMATHLARWEDGCSPERVLALNSSARTLVIPTGRYADPLDRSVRFYGASNPVPLLEPLVR